eukprot:CAMPEP_0203637774 /NCGR_PEP_ID=MMETSP0088-20131115/4013_1 /ASSEMBLY_ACC=CAM_ASM_001087 /TAXON_ID=426623 /ORGANISM="Chaetoceros affinis, Strain CCMP159" /LENGTH=89 /DNA_ID=CAMNT_0050492293 /DNA_START=29 /DNA_END=298 /DNA_ORIENTATION=-
MSKAERIQSYTIHQGEHDYDDGYLSDDYDPYDFNLNGIKGGGNGRGQAKVDQLKKKGGGGGKGVYNQKHVRVRESMYENSKVKRANKKR